MADHKETAGGDTQQERHKLNAKKIKFLFASCILLWYNLICSDEICSLGQVVKTSPSHGGIRGSTPLASTKEKALQTAGLFSRQSFNKKAECADYLLGRALRFFSSLKSCFNELELLTRAFLKGSSLKAEKQLLMLNYCDI